MKVTETLQDRTPREQPSQRKGARLLLVLQCDRPREPTLVFSLHKIDRVTLQRARGPGVSVNADGSSSSIAIGLPDPFVSSCHAQLARTGPLWQVADLGSRNGIYVNGRGVQAAALASGDLIRVGRSLFLYRIERLVEDELNHDSNSLPLPELMTHTQNLAGQFFHLRHIARTPISVLIEGESGTGKEIVARAVHELSGRTGPFIPVNCAALPESLVESELFGSCRGAFSGADRDRPGLIRSASGGTLFLDEIGDLPAASQPALLRVLQEHEVLPVGGTRPVAVDVRVIAATNRDLTRMVASGKFRGDLYSRLAGHPVKLPRLRDRLEDLGQLIGALLGRIAPAQDVMFTVEAAESLFAHTWPFNIRELEQCLARAVTLAGNRAIHLQDLQLRDSAPPRRRRLSPRDEERRSEIEMWLRENDGNVAAVGRAMGKAPVQIRRWISRYGIDIDQYRT